MPRRGRSRRENDKGALKLRRRSWGWRVAALVAGLALVMGLAACGDDDDEGDGGGGESRAITIQYVTDENHPYGRAVNAFVEEVNAADVGLTLTGQPSNPTPEPDLIDQLSGGSVEMATISSAVWDTKDVTAFQALQAPFLVDNYALEREVLNGEIGASMIEQANQQARNIQVLAIHEGGLRKPLGRDKAFTKPADFRGATIRSVQSQVLATGLRALGANPDPLPLPEVYQALQSGTVDGMEANFGLIAGQQYYEVARFVTGNVNFWPFPTVLAMNKDVWDSLTAEQQEALTTAAGNIDDTSLDIVSSPSDLPQQLVNCGLRIVTASDADREALTRAGQRAIPQLPAETQELVRQIQEVKDNLPAGAAPPPLPTEPTGECELGG